MDEAELEVEELDVVPPVLPSTRSELEPEPEQELEPEPEPELEREPLAALPPPALDSLGGGLEIGALDGLAAEEERIAEQLRFARVSSDLRYSAKVAAKRKERDLTVGNFSRAANRNAAEVHASVAAAPAGPEREMAAGVMAAAREDAVAVGHALHLKHTNSDRRYAARLEEKRIDKVDHQQEGDLEGDELMAVAPLPPALAARQAWLDGPSSGDGHPRRQKVVPGSGDSRPGRSIRCRHWMFVSCCYGHVHGVPAPHFVWLLLQAAIPTAETVTNYLVYLSWHSQTCAEEAISCNPIYSWAPSLGLSLQVFAALIVGIYWICRISSDAQTHGTPSRCVNLLCALLMSSGLAPLMYCMIVLRPQLKVDYPRDKRMLQHIGLLVLFTEVLPQALLQIFVSVVDRSNSYIATSLAIAVVGGASSCAAFETMSRIDAQAGSRFHTVTLVMRGAQITAMVSLIALLGCGFGQTAVGFLGPALMIFGLMISESYHRGEQGKAQAKAMRRTHLLGALQLLWFAAAFGQFYFGEHEANSYREGMALGGDEQYDCKTSRVVNLAVFSTALFACALPMSWLTDPKFGWARCRHKRYDEIIKEAETRIAAEGGDLFAEQVGALWRWCTFGELQDRQDTMSQDEMNRDSDDRYIDTDCCVHPLCSALLLFFALSCIYYISPTRDIASKENTTVMLRNPD